MTGLPSADTSEAAAAFQMETYRRLGAAKRAEIAAALSDELREVTLAGIRRRHPDYSDAVCRQALLRLILGDDLVRSIWPHRRLVDP